MSTRDFSEGPVLVAIEGTLAPASWPLDKAITIGSGEDDFLRCEDPELSPRHAVVFMHAGKWHCMDNGSRTGTFVDGERNPLHARELFGGEEIRCGAQVFRIDIPKPEPERVLSAEILACLQQIAPHGSRGVVRARAAAPNLESKLDPRLLAWTAEQGWQGLKECQLDAASAILSGDNDVLITGPSGTGKTLAAWFPIVTRIAETNQRVLYLSPSRAAADDVHRRLTPICSRLGVWQRQILSATPEWLERMILQRRENFGNLFAIIIDDADWLIRSTRGAQTQSLLSRLDARVGKHVRRIAIGEDESAAEFLVGEYVAVSSDEALPLDVRILSLPWPPDSDFVALAGGATTLVFAPSRATTEQCADALGTAGVLTAIHHSSLSKEAREAAMRALADPANPTACVTSGTLETGIRVDHLKHVIQIGPPPSVAALARRAGRAAPNAERTLTVVVRGEPWDPRDEFDQLLRFDLAQAIASVELMREGWREPPESALTSLAQQVLSIISERGLVNAEELFDQIAAVPGFALFAGDLPGIIESFFEKGLVTISDDLAVSLDLAGLNEARRTDFCTCFQTSEQVRVMHEGEHIGNVSVFHEPGENIVLGGRRWKIERIDHASRSLTVSPAKESGVARFSGSGPMVCAPVRERMREIYEREDVPGFLDERAWVQFEKARSSFRELGLSRCVLECGGRARIFHWSGDREARTICLMLEANRLAAWPYNHTILAEATVEQTLRAMRECLSDPPRPSRLARETRAPIGKYDWALPKELVLREKERELLAYDEALAVMRRIVSAGP